MHEFNKQFKAGMYLFNSNYHSSANIFKNIYFVEIQRAIVTLETYKNDRRKLSDRLLNIICYSILDSQARVCELIKKYSKFKLMSYIAQSSVSLISGLNTYVFIAYHQMRSICKSLKIGGETQFDQHNLVFTNNKLYLRNIVKNFLGRNLFDLSRIFVSFHLINSQI